jgi:hypothetical protein
MPQTGEDPLEDFARTGLARLGLEATEPELAVMSAVDAIYRPHFEALIRADLSQVEPERRLDPGRAPE